MVVGKRSSHSAVYAILVDAAFVLVAVCAAYTLGLIVSLTHGGLSYEACALKWDYILDVNRKEAGAKPAAAG